MVAPKAQRFEVCLSASDVRKLHRFVRLVAEANGEAVNLDKAGAFVQGFVEHYLNTFQAGH